MADRMINGNTLSAALAGENRMSSPASGIPAEGFLGVLGRPGGGYSTELNIGVSDDRLNRGRVSNIPLLVPGQVDVDNLLAGHRPTRMQVEHAINHAVERQKNGEVIPSFDSSEEAERFATARHRLIEESNFRRGIR